jgi:4-oxalocrotonate tautomerase
MPLVNVRVIEGVFTPEQKTEMIHQLTEAMVRIEGENLRPVTWVVVDEVKGGDWGIGGKSLSAADVHALQGKAPAGVSG